LQRERERERELYLEEVIEGELLIGEDEIRQGTQWAELRYETDRPWYGGGSNVAQHEFAAQPRQQVHFPVVSERV